MKIKLLLFILWGFSLAGFSQSSQAILAQKEKDVNTTLAQLRSAHVDSNLLKFNKTFTKTLADFLHQKGAFDYPLTSIHKSIGDIYSQDKLVRILSWNVQMTDKSQHYFCFILKRDKHHLNDVTVTQLQSVPQDFRVLANRTIHENNWYGGLYYKIVDVNRGSKTYYTLLAYCTNQKDVSTKLIDVLTFRRGVPSLGYSLFDTGNRRERPKRIIFQYSRKASMSVRFHPERQMIIFDHLSPETPSLKGVKAYYVPDFSYDAYLWTGREWELKNDVIAVNKPESKELDLKAYDHDADSVITIKTKRKWINPTDASNPIGNGSHQAVTPEDVQKADKKAKKTTKKKRRKQSDYKGYHYTDYGK